MRGGAFAASSYLIVNNGCDSVRAISSTTTNAPDYLYVLTSKPSDSNVSLAGINWSISSVELNSYNKSYAGVQFGASKKSGSISLTTSESWGAIEGDYFGYEVIDEVNVWLNTGKAGSVTCSVIIDGIETIPSSSNGAVAKNSSASSYKDATKLSFSPSEGHEKGNICISASTTTAAGYLCAIEVVSHKVNYKYDVTFENEGQVYKTLTGIEPGSHISAPEDPTRDNFTFDGWYIGPSKWDFENDCVNSDITLTAMWSSEIYADVQTDLNDVNSYFGLSYKYSKSVSDVAIEISPAVNKTNYSGIVTLGNVTTIDLSSEFGSSAENLFAINWNKNDSSNFYFKTGETRLYRNGGELVIAPKGDYAVSEAKFSGTNTDKLTVTKLDSGGLSIKNETTDTIITIKTISLTYSKRTYSDVDFRFKIAVDKKIDMVGNESSFDSITCGIQISTDSKVLNYNIVDSTKRDVTTNMPYLIVDLGDIINNLDRASVVFSARAFAVVDSEVTLYSSNVKQYSIKSAVQKYYSDGDSEVKAVVEELYNLL